jgi:co-chaperonin GroES (HSP10)
MNKQVNFQVLNNDVLVNLPTVSKTTESGVIKSDSMLAEEMKKLDKFLTVVNVGIDVKSINPGDKIMIGSGKHPQIEIDGNMYLIVNELHILGKRIN